MEILIKNQEDLKSLNPGDMVIVDSPSMKNEPMVLVVKLLVHKYPITIVGGTLDGKKHYNKWKGKKLKSVFPEENGDIGDEMIISYEFSGDISTFTLSEIDEDKEILGWNIRKIDENHSKYDKDAVAEAKMFGEFLNKFEDDVDR